MTKINRILPTNIPKKNVANIVDQLNGIGGIKCESIESQTQLDIEIESSNPDDILSLGIIVGMLEYKNIK